MPRVSPITPQLLHLVEQGDVESIRRLGEFLNHGNANADISGVVFKRLAAYPLALVSGPKSFLARTIVGAGASACLSVIWGLVGVEGTLKPEAKQSLISHMQELRDSVFGWSRICLQYGLPYIPERVIGKARPLDLDIYLSQARILLQLLALEKEFAAEMLTSASFADLFLELWTAEEGRDTTDTLSYRMVDSASDEHCPIITLFARFTCDSHSLEALLARCKKTSRCDELCLALTDRVSRGWEDESVPFLGWIQSLDRLILAAYRLCTSTRRLRKRLTSISYLTPFSSELKAYSETMADDSNLHELLALAVIPMLTLSRLASSGDTPSIVRANWSDLQWANEYMEALFNVTAGKTDEDDRHLQHLLTVLTQLGELMVYPRIFGKWGVSELDVGKLVHLPRAARSWSFFLRAHNRAAQAYKSLKIRPSVYFCDYLPCGLVGKDLEKPPKQCTGCSSVVYCSDECQKKDWEELHRHECRHAQVLHAARRSSHTWYTHQTRASQAALLEVIYEQESDNEQYNSNTIYPVFDCSFMDSLDEDSYIEDILEGAYWDDSFPQTYLRPRLDSLMKAYNDGTVAPGWRLADGIFPSIGDESSIHLAVLLKPVEGGFRTIYCVPRYSHFCCIAPTVDGSEGASRR
ncbi:hypothetical protein NMY22_g12518 [Coprinellus aureogranulatus]|nr:hypothetical protein NMY22_g12518 [Coprinellus aureogranulatus]